MSVIRTVISAHKRYHLGVVPMQNLTIPLRPSTWRQIKKLKAFVKTKLFVGHVYCHQKPTKFRRIAEERKNNVKEIQRRPRGVHSADLMLPSQHRQPSFDKTSTPKQRLKLPSFVSQPPKDHPNLHAPRSLRASRLELFSFSIALTIQTSSWFAIGHWLLALTCDLAGTVANPLAFAVFCTRSHCDPKLELSSLHNAYE